jgi:N-formylglutamate amidohydrolase
MQMAAPFSVYNGGDPATPVLLSVPHAGRDYPAKLLSNLRVPAAELLRLEDRYADRLVQPAVAAGFPTIIANRARAWIDLNRAANDIDTQMLIGLNIGPAEVISAKTRGGLGLIPRRLQACGELWRAPISREDVDRRITEVHQPYHQSVSTILSAMRDRFGTAILLDVHSMPPIPPRYGAGYAAENTPQIVLGDRFGGSAASIYAELVMSHMRQQGFQVALNSPYSGDFILQAHGDPRRGVHALQLEVDRSLYLDSALREPNAQLSSIARLVHEIAALLADQAIGSTYAEAAE